MARPLPDGVDGALQGTAKPYGFTITIWASGAALISSRGTPGTGEVFLFAAGAVAAYGLLRVISGSRGFEGQTQLESRKGHLLSAGAFHVGAIRDVSRTGAGVAASRAQPQACDLPRRPGAGLGRLRDR